MESISDEELIGWHLERPSFFHIVACIHYCKNKSTNIKYVQCHLEQVQPFPMFIFKLVLCQLYVQDQPTWRENSWAESDSATQKKLNDLNQHFGHAVEIGRGSCHMPYTKFTFVGAHLPQLIKIEVCEPCLPLAARSFRLAVPREPGKYVQHISIYYIFYS